MSWMTIDLPPPAPKSVRHLLHLYHSSLVYMPSKHDQAANADNDTLSSTETSEEEEEEEEEEEGMKLAIPSAIVLQEAGVKFKQVKEGSILDVKFNNGIITTPSLLIDTTIHSQLRILIAFEQFYPPLLQKCQSSCNFSGYLDFIHYIIEKPKDIALLNQNGILKYLMGSEEHIAHLFKSITSGATIPSKHYLSDTFKEVNKYCKGRRHKWRASLMQNYFNSPWAVASTVAAVILLLFTFIQTFFSVFTTFHH